MNVRTPSDIALLVRERRRELRMSQHELARRITASRQWVQNLEQGRPGLELGLTLRALAALGLSLDAREPDSRVVPEAGSRQPSSPARGPAPLLRVDLNSIVGVDRPGGASRESRGPGAHRVAAPANAKR